jgi:trimethylamine--corrinoid protein Co-methyltransferase
MGIAGIDRDVLGPPSRRGGRAQMPTFLAEVAHFVAAAPTAAAPLHRIERDRVAGAQLARFYRCPSHTTAPNSDNHAHDEQNAWEKALSLFCSVGAGNDLIVNCGMFATGMTCSDEQLLIDAELAAMCRRLAAGVKVTKATIAADLIRQVGPQGESYLTQDHTMKRLRSDEFLVPDLAVRGPLASWRAAGAHDTAAKARALARKLLREE